MPQPHPRTPGSSNSALPRLYVITDRAATAGRDLGDVIARLVAGVPRGAVMVQLREKDLGTRALVALARDLVRITAARGCKLFINDRLDVALAAGADGVHLPERGLDVAAARAVAGPGFLIGASTHSPEAAARAARAGADVIVCGPVWATPSKAGKGKPLGIAGLSRAARALAGTGARLYALGGVTHAERVHAARAAGAHGVAGIRAFMAARDPGAAAATLHAAASTGH